MIIVSGCSWSDANFTTAFHPEMDCSWPKWFDHINTDKEVMCVGNSGNSNQKILDMALEQVLSNPKVTSVVCALSEWSRFPLFEASIHPALMHNHQEALETPPEKRNMHQHDVLDKLGHLVEFYNSLVGLKNIPQSSYIACIVNDTVLRLKALQEVCKGRGIRLVVFQMLHPIPYQFKARAVKTLISNNIFQEMFEESHDDFINFPFFEDLGGSNAEYELMHKLKDYHDYTVSKQDLHPNGKGHKRIADWFNDRVSGL